MNKTTKMTAHEKVHYMQTENIPKLIGKLSVPTIISMLITAFYNLADTMFVGRINTQATAAVGIVFSVMGIIQALGFLFGHGSGNYISRKLGAEEFDNAETMSACGFFYALMLGTLVSILGLIFLKPLAVFLGSTPTILPYTIDYLRIILIGAPFAMGGFVINNQLRFQGSATYAMIGICSGAVLNMGLDPLLIFVRDMGVAGAALSTVISQVVSFILLFIMSKQGNDISPNYRKFVFSGYYFKEIFKGGVPSLIRQGLGSISTTLLNRAAGNYGAEIGDAAIAAMSIVGRVFMFCNSALIGFGQGFQPVCGVNYGGKKYNRVREAFLFCLKVGTGVLIVISIVCFTFAKPIVTAFRKEDLDVIRIGTLALRLQMVSFPLSGLIIFCNMMLQSVGKAGKASIVAAARQGLFLIPIVLFLPYILQHFWGNGLLGVQMAQMCADICSFLLALPMAISFLNEMSREQAKL